MKLSIQLGRREFSFGMTKAAVSPDIAAWLRAEDVDASGEGAKLTAPYSQSAWVYIAISRLAEKISSLPFRISRMESETAKRVRAVRGSTNPKHRAFVRRALDEEIVEGGEVVDLFARPHPNMSRQLFWELVVTWNCLRGEFFVLPLDEMDAPVDLAGSAPRVARLLTLPTELFWHIVTGYELSAWRYTGSPLLTPVPSEMLLPSEVIHSRTPNPYLFWRGMSPLAVAMLAAGADYAAAAYNKGYWLNNADTGVIVTTEQQATLEQRAAILAALRERKRKAGTADRPLFLWGGAKVEKPQLNGMEQQFIENRRMNRQEIGAIFKVPESVMGFTESKSGALSGGGTAINQEILFWLTSTITPLCRHLEAALEPVVKTFGGGLIGWFDVESDPVMQEARRARLDAGVKAFGIGAAFNDINRVYDLGFPEYAGWGDKNFLPFSLQEASHLGAEPLPGEEEPELEEEKGNLFTGMRRLLERVTGGPPQEQKANTEVLWHAHVATRRKLVKMFEAKTRRVLLEFRGKVLAKIAEIDLKSLAEFSPSGSETRGLVDLIFSPAEFGKSLLNVLTQPITNALQTAGDELLKEMGVDDPWKMSPQTATDFLARREQPIMDTGRTVRRRLNGSLQEGLDAGETMEELSDRVRGVFNDLTQGEARRIAQTETNLAYNHARQEAMSDSGVGYKAWLSSHGPNVRPAHAAAENFYINAPIPLDEPFVVGGEELMYPGDDSLGASAGNIINCQCIQLAARKESEDATSVAYFVWGAGKMVFPKAEALK